MTKLYLPTSGPDWFSGFVVLDMTEAVLSSARHRIELLHNIKKERWDDLYQLRFWDYHPELHEGSPFEESTSRRIECCMSVIQDGGVYWRWLMKHCGDEMSTPYLHPDSLSKIMEEHPVFWVDQDLVDQWDPHEEKGISEVIPYMEKS